MTLGEKKIRARDGRPLRRPFFAFDLDGTVTRAEMLPRLAARLKDADAAAEVVRLTARALAGDLPFAESFRRRFAILNRLPLPEILDVARSLPLDGDIAAFIRSNRDDCAVITGNLDRWIEPLAARLGCRVFCSEARESGDQGLEIASILDKGAAVRRLRAGGRQVVAVGESAADIPMFQAADLGIAFAGLHAPAPALLARADAVFSDGASLCAFLSELSAA